MRILGAVLALCLLAGCGASIGPATQTAGQVETAVAPSQDTAHYQNPLKIAGPGTHWVESCADPNITRAHDPNDSNWYMYCTANPMYEGSGVHWIPISKSSDLVHWTYVGDVFDQRPLPVADGAGVWAPEVQFFNGKYYLYYTASNTTIGPGGSAIFVATSDNPVGPWTAYPTAVIEPHGASRWTYDPDIVEDNGVRYVFYGSFGGGVAARQLSADGLSSLPQTEVKIAREDRYEGTYITKHDGYFYFMGSASDCCRGALTGYSVFAARSTNLLGPYVDADGVSLLDSRVGGTPVIAMNGNGWVGSGHNTMVTDASGQDWMIYHSTPANNPYFTNGVQRRPALLDPIDWIGGWPVVRGGAGPSNDLQTAPVVTPGAPNLHVTNVDIGDQPGELITSSSDEFDGQQLGSNWSWVRPPSYSMYGVASGMLRFNTQNGDLNNALQLPSVLTERAPSGDFIVETRMVTNVPATGSLPFVQSGLVIYGDDNSYVKAVEVAIHQTRQIEFATRTTVTPNQQAAYGTSVLSSPAELTYLRIARHVSDGQERYTAYASHDGVVWHRGSTWTTSLGANPKIGVISMGGAGYTSWFDYVRVYKIAASPIGKDLGGTSGMQRNRLETISDLEVIEKTFGTSSRQLARVNAAMFPALGQ